MTHALNIVWNPSEGIDLGFFIIRFYSLMFVIAFGLGYIMKTSLNVRVNLLRN
jgi:prolipoprotein diacylglyceryltransferase